MKPQKLLWDWGTAYDLFASLHVINKPDSFGLRASWAAGVRSRLPSEARDILEASDDLMFVPVHWIYQLPDPKDADTALQALAQIPPKDRLPALACDPGMSADVQSVFREVAANGMWDSNDLQALREAYREKKPAPKTEKLTHTLDIWAQPGKFGENYLSALRVYQEVFFSEEEKRIRPALQEALQKAQEIAEELDFEDLIEELSQGVRFEAKLGFEEVVFAPSYWITPIVIWQKIAEDSGLVMFGARPPDASLVPGESVPDSLLHTLKALADPTRLRILRYLSEDSNTPAELARRLRLRAPTVTHHLNTLRLAGLVQIIVEEKGEKLYGSRLSAVKNMCDNLFRYMGVEGDLDEIT